MFIYPFTFLGNNQFREKLKFSLVPQSKNLATPLIRPGSREFREKLKPFRLRSGHSDLI